jgi:hypothetical protein
VRRVWDLWLSAVLIAAAVLAGAPARAEEPTAVAVSVGRFGVLDGAEITAAGGEVRFAPRHYSWGPLGWLPGLSPDLGAMATSSGSLYLYGGLRRDLALGDRWQLGLQLAGGLYYRAGGTDLGAPLQFRSGLELTRRIGARHRLGLLFYHLSNAGLYRYNPGTEALMLTFSSRP